MVRSYFNLVLYFQNVRILKFQRVGIISNKYDRHHYIGQTYDKFEEISLASQGWHNKKSAGDKFILNDYAKVSLTFIH